MARSETTDYMQSFRYHIIGSLAGQQDFDPMAFSGVEGGADSPVAGFQSCTLPEVSQDVIEYREGVFQFTRKYLGIPVFTDVTLMRGMALKDTAFFDWARRGWEGGEYRADFQILHFSRDVLESGGLSAGEPTEGTKRYNCHECMCIRAKPGGDLDATSAEVSLGEVDFSIEWFDITDK